MFRQAHRSCQRGQYARVEGLESRQLMAAPVEGQPFNYRVTFNSHELKPMTAGDYSVEVNWGDGTKTVTRDIKQINTYQSFEAFATKTYVDSGTLKGDRSVIVRNLKTGKTWAQTQIIGSVEDAPINVAANDIVVDEKKLYGGVVASFESACAYDTPDEFYARVLWGDGTSSVATVTGGGGKFEVTAKHTFASTRPIPYITDVFVKDEGGSNDGDKGKATVNATQTPDQVRNINGQTQNLQKSPVLAEFAKQLGKTTADVLAAAADAVKSFSTGLLTSTAPPSVSVNDPAKYPFSRSFFDAGRLTRSIGGVPADLYNLGAFIVKNPQIFSADFANKLVAEAQKWTGKTFASPEAALGALFEGFNAFARVDPADLAGKTVGPMVWGKVFTGFGGAVLSKLTPAQRFGLKPIWAAGNAEVFIAGEGAVSLFGRGAVPLASVEHIVNAMRMVNSGNFGTNCVNVVMAVEKRLAGVITHDYSALGSGLTDLVGLEKAFGGVFKTVTNRTLMEAELLKSAINGEARGILALQKPGLHLVGNKYVYRPGHVVNVVYKQGSGIWYIDGQSGFAYAFNSPEAAAFLKPYSKTMSFLKTHGK